jgi:hypothetical protein
VYHYTTPQNAANILEDGQIAVSPQTGEVWVSDSAWESWRLHTLDVRMEHDRETNREAIPR